MSGGELSEPTDEILASRGRAPVRDRDLHRPETAARVHEDPIESRARVAAILAAIARIACPDHPPTMRTTTPDTLPDLGALAPGCSQERPREILYRLC